MICNIVSILPRKYDCATELSKPTNCEEKEIMKQKHVCYFVMNNGCIEEKYDFCEISQRDENYFGWRGYGEYDA